MRASIQSATSPMTVSCSGSFIVSWYRPSYSVQRHVVRRRRPGEPLRAARRRDGVGRAVKEQERQRERRGALLDPLRGAQNLQRQSRPDARDGVELVLAVRPLDGAVVRQLRQVQLRHDLLRTPPAPRTARRGRAGSGPETCAARPTRARARPDLCAPRSATQLAATSPPIEWPISTTGRLARRGAHPVHHRVQVGQVVLERHHVGAGAARVSVTALVVGEHVQPAAHQAGGEVRVAPAVLVNAVDEHDRAPVAKVGRPAAREEVGSVGGRQRVGGVVHWRVEGFRGGRVEGERRFRR